MISNNNNKSLNDLTLIKEQWKVMTKNYFKLLEREKKG